MQCFRSHMLRAGFLLAIALLVLASTGPVLAASISSESTHVSQTGPYATSSGAVYVRGGPGTGFFVLGTLYQGEVVPILGVSPDGGWWYVAARFGEGWVAGTGVTASSADSVAVRDPGPIATVTAGVLNVRGGAGPNAASLGRLSQGQQVLVTGTNEDGSWLQIRWAYGTGWVSSQYVRITGGAVTATLAVTSDRPYGIVLSAFLNVRTGPGVNYALLGQVAGGTTLPIVGRSANNTWYQVETPLGTGWVSAAYVALRNEYGAAPITTGNLAGAAVSGPIAIVNTGALHIRSGPGPQYTSLGTLAGGEEAQIIGRSADWSWWLLETRVGTGWASSMYIIARGDTTGVPYVAPGATVTPQAGQAGGAAPAPAIAGPVAIVTTGALNIRSGPNSAFPSLGSVLSGTQMPIIGQSPDRGWWLVESPYGNGWVSKLYVVTNGSTSNVPVVS